jgi:hypothetical protein
MYKIGRISLRKRDNQVTSGKALNTPQRHIAPGINGTKDCMFQKYNGIDNRRMLRTTNTTEKVK